MAKFYEIKIFMFLILISIGCSENHIISSKKDYEMYNLTNVVENSSNKHEIFESCQAFLLEPDEYVLFSNGTAYVEAYNKTYNSSFYVLTGDILTVCAPNEEIEEHFEKNGGFSHPRYDMVFLYITRTCLIISIVCLLAHLAAFCIVPDLKNLPGYNMASLCVTLLLSYVSFLVGSDTTIEDSGTPCIAVATLTYFFLLSSFMWMAVMAFDVFRSLLKATGKLRLATRRFVCRRFLVYCLFAWGVPLVFVITVLILDNVDGVSDEYRPLLGNDVCWFRGRKALLILFGIPVFAVTLANIIFFGSSAFIIFRNRMRTDQVAYWKTMKTNFTMHYRLATIMGLTWVVGFANSTNSFWLLYIYTILSCLQGLFIFLACTCTSRVRNCIMNKLHVRVRKTSTQSTGPTFQSYWNEEFIDDSNVYIISGKENWTDQKV